MNEIIKKTVKIGMIVGLIFRYVQNTLFYFENSFDEKH